MLDTQLCLRIATCRNTSNVTCGSRGSVFCLGCLCMANVVFRLFFKELEPKANEENKIFKGDLYSSFLLTHLDYIIWIYNKEHFTTVRKYIPSNECSKIVLKHT